MRFAPRAIRRGGKYDFGLFLFRFQKQTKFGIEAIAG
jgi:hypothetical protein